MRVLFLGDIVARSGRTVVSKELPSLRRALKLDFVVRLDLTLTFISNSIHRLFRV